MSAVTSSEENVFRTPGPWSVDPTTGLDVRGPDGKDVCVALCTDMHQLQFNMATIGPQSRQQAFDNAMLIAAAPQLFVALQAAQKRLEQIDDNCAPAVEVRLLIGEALAKAVSL